LSPEETFHRAFRFQEFDIAEISLSSHVATVSNGAANYVGIPVFLSRVFRHSGIYIRTDRISRPEDLRGMRIGVPEYQQTANVWARGILKDEYGIEPSEIKWRNGGLEVPGRTERTRLQLPPTIDLQSIPKDQTLSGMLESGELDGIISPREPQCFSKGRPDIGRLFPDYRPLEEAYFQKTRIFPIMHLIGIRKDIAERHPWLAVSLCKAFDKARELALEELGMIGRLSVMLPWCVSELQRTREIMGRDFWPYGLEANKAQLQAFARYSCEQGLSATTVNAEDLFAPSTLELSKN
jgi:4,5-dihydroxyphthalate decarboxylase